MATPTTTNTRRHLWGAAVAAAIGLVLAVPRAEAAGLLVADGGFGGALEIKEHTARVVINNNIAVTEVEQVFVNLENRQVEALYTFPVPSGASVANFSMWINGKEMIGEVVEKERARQIYESYKRKRRDPGLLEQVDYKTFEMRIFPIGPKAEQRVRLTYYQELDPDHDWATYVYPLATITRTDIDQRATGKFSLNLEVKSEVPIVAMESPSHPDEFVIVKQDNGYVQASFEAAGGELSRDMVLAYQLSRPVTGIDMITSKERREDGYFSLTLTSGEDLATKGAGMDYVFILDVSGSMSGGAKLHLSRSQLEAFVRALGDQDRFDVIAFNIQALPLFNRLETVTDATRDLAADFLDAQRAQGGTTLAPALSFAYKYRDPDRDLNVVVLSDGMTEQNERAALLQLIRQRPDKTRVFCIGVGNEVNRPLLEQLAEEAGGLAAFLSRGDDFTRQAKAFQRKLMHPVATDVRLSFAGVRVYDVEPPTLPNLYHGAPVRVYGRYEGSGEASVKLEAFVDGRPIEQVTRFDLPKVNENNPEIERMWAWHRIDRLLKERERAGAATGILDEVVRLGEAYSIATEYTSFIVLENDAEYARWKIDRRNALRVERDRRTQQALAARLRQMQDEALSNLGPAPAAERVVDARPTPAATPTSVATRAPNALPQASPQTAPSASRASRRRRFHSGGGGAIDPVTGLVTIGLAGLVAARSRRKGKSQDPTKAD